MARRPAVFRGLWDRLVTLLDVIGSQTGTFDEGMVTCDPLDARGWGAYVSRVQRYRLLWALYENTAYSNVHAWSANFRKQYGLYAWTRNIYNPAFRLGEFHATHLMGGDLDDEAGDGSERSTALPILTDNKAVRTGISTLWKTSKWQAKKTQWCRYGAVYGDSFLKVVDDPNARKITLCPVLPAQVRHVDYDDYGNVRAYLLEYFRPDPTWTWSPDSATQPLVPYSELCEQFGDSVRFRTFMSGRPYDWHVYWPGDVEIGYDWTRPYPFVPLVGVQHIDQGFGWGHAECQAAHSRIRECDDLGSIITDQGRRILNSPWVASGRKPSTKLFDTKKPQPTDEGTIADTNTTTITGRDRLSIVWVDPQQNGGRAVTLQQLVGNMPIAEIGASIDRILRALEQDFPELAMAGTDSGDSGRARRLPRQQVEAKVHERRSNYDSALVVAHKMGLHMGALGRYPGYEGLSVADYKAGNLDHRIDKRAVFSVDPMDEYEEEAAVVTCLQTAANADPALVPITMRRLGYASKDIRAVEDSIALAQVAQAAKVLAPQVTPGQNPIGPLGATAPQPAGEARNGQAVGG